MEFGIRILLLLAAAIFFLISIFATEKAFDMLALGLLFVAVAMIVEATPLGKMKWNTSGGGGTPPRQ